MTGTSKPVQTVVRLTFGDDVFDVVGLMASEVAKISLWTGLASKRAWISALGDEDIEALRAGKALMLQRRGEDVRFSDVDFDTDTVTVAMADGVTGREIDPVLVLDDDGEPKLDKKGRPSFVQVDGRDAWRFTDDGSPVPPTVA